MFKTAAGVTVSETSKVCEVASRMFVDMERRLLSRTKLMGPPATPDQVRRTVDLSSSISMSHWLRGVASGRSSIGISSASNQMVLTFVFITASDMLIVVHDDLL